MSDDYSSSDGGSCDSGSSSHSDCSSSSSDPAPCSSSADMDRQFANDLLMYGMATQLFTTDDSGTIRRERIAPEDFVIMRRDRDRGVSPPYLGAMRDQPNRGCEPWSETEQRSRAYAETDRRATLRYGEQPMIVGELDPFPEMKPGKVTWVTGMPCQETRWNPLWRRALFACACIIATVALIRWWFP